MSIDVGRLKKQRNKTAAKFVCISTLSVTEIGCFNDSSASDV